MPPISEPENCRRPMIRLKTWTGSGCGWYAHLGEGAVAFQQCQISIDVVWRGNGIEDEMEAVEMFLHLVLVSGDDHFVRAQAQGILHFAR